MKFVIFKLTLIKLILSFTEFPETILFAFGKIAFEMDTVIIIFNPFSMIVTIKPATFVSISSSRYIDPVATWFTVLPLSFVVVVVLISELAHAMLEIVLPLAFIVISVWKRKLMEAIFHVNGCRFAKRTFGFLSVR
jgi:hypothetical protein